MHWWRSTHQRRPLTGRLPGRRAVEHRFCRRRSGSDCPGVRKPGGWICRTGRNGQSIRGHRRSGWGYSWVGGGSGLKSGGAPQLLPNTAFLFRKCGGQADHHLGVQVAAFAGFSLGQAASANPEFVAGIRARRHPEFDLALQSGDFDLGPQDGFPGATSSSW